MFEEVKEVWRGCGLSMNVVYKSDMSAEEGHDEINANKIKRRK